MKSGIITMNVEITGVNSKGTTIVYFDEYGKKQSIETIRETQIMGNMVKSHTLSFQKDGYQYVIDYDAKTATRRKLDSNSRGGSFDFASLTEDEKKRYNVRKTGTDNVLGKTCDLYSIGSDSLQMKGTFSVWNNITLKMEVETGSPASFVMKSRVTAVKFEEDVAIPADKYAVPEGYKVEDELQQQN